jgi:FKBP-type peptidyl-prolyl cis-trans isomerase FklB
MIKLKWIALAGFGLIAMQANAEQATATKAAVATPLKAESPAKLQAEANKANRERALKGGKISPKQRAELDKAASAGKNVTEGEAFLAANKAKAGVLSLAGGVQYRVISEGKGKQKPTEKSTVVCRYQGKLIDGTGFDKADGKKLSTLKVAGLVPGLKQAVKNMTTGSKWEIVVPPKLAYGKKGYRDVGPNAVVVYEMEIVSIK